MIKNISKLIDFGIFHKLMEGEKPPDFKKSNLIYAWNRSGKTTLSRIFASCEKKCTYDKDKFKRYPTTLDENGNLISEGTFEIKTTDGKTVSSANVSTNVLPIKVFNQDFIDENIFFDSDSCNPIAYISEEDIVSKKKLEKLEQDKIKLNGEYEKAETERFSAEKTKGEFLTNLGREVSNALFDKTYNKIKVEKIINKIIDDFSDRILSDEDKRNCDSISRSNAAPEQTSPSNYKFSFSFNGKSTDNFQQVFVEVEKLLQKHVISETLSRLKNDPDLNNWVKHGFDLHRSKSEKEKCLFCEKPLDNEFLTILSKHFSKDYEELQNVINQLKKGLSEIKPSFIPAKNDELYPNLKDDYTNQAEQLNQCIKEINTWIDSAIEKLQSKYNNPLVVVANPAKPRDFLAIYDKILTKLDAVIERHNKKSKNHENEVLDAQEKIELHLIATALTEGNYKKIVTDIEIALGREMVAKDAVDKNLSEIEPLKKQNSDIGIAPGKINDCLKEFFGRNEIELDVDEDKKGYVIKRNAQIAKNLSEGEKTAIAFSYFIVKVEEEGFDKSKGIIFIDDPISSLDSNFIYHCFAMIKTHFKGVKQLFISTHNFQLFNLVKDWFLKKNANNEANNKKKGKENPDPCGFFMVERFADDLEKPISKISALDRTLLDFRSEYNFLFSKIKKFSEDPNVQYDNLYTIGNMTRRFLEIFADFKIPQEDNLRAKMNAIIEHAPGEKISSADTEKVYILLNALCHNSEPVCTIEHIDKSEVKDTIKILLNIVKSSDLKHYEALEESSSP